MIKVNRDNRVKMGIPPAFRERCALRVTDYKVGPNKNSDEMLTINLELGGYFNDSGTLETQIERDGKIYKIAGLRMQPMRFTFNEKAIGIYARWWEMVHKDQFPEEFDETNPDLAYLEDLKLQAVVQGSNRTMRKLLSDEEKALKKANNEELVGDPILNEDGEPLEEANLYIQNDNWLGKTAAEFPEPY